MTKDFILSEKDGFIISTDPSKLDKALIHRFLAEDSYWAEGTTEKEVGDTMDGSLCYGVYLGDQQVGFASVETDYASYAYLTDIFIVEEYRGQGLSQWLIETILSHPDLQELDSWMLITEDAQGLYEKFGFRAVPGSPGHMERRREGR